MVKKRIDYTFLFCVVFLLCLGIVIIFGISAPLSQEVYGKTYHFVTHQLIFGILPGLILGFLAFKARLSFLKKWSFYFFLLNLILLLLVFLPKSGESNKEAVRWVKIGSLSFQPSEPLKISLLLYLASWLNNRKKKNLQIFTLFLLILLPVAVALYIQPDIGTLSLILAMAFAVYFLAETPFWHTLLMLFLGIAVIFLLINIAPYRMERFLVFISPDIDPMGMGYQLKQAGISIGAGGILGKGLGMSKQKFGLLPHPMSDSVFAIFCEEAGFLGALVLLLSFLVLFGRAAKIANEKKDQFSQLVVLGFAIQIMVQSFFNIGSMIGLLPLTGIPLPFISYGGSHIVTELIGVGIVLNISKNS